MQLAAFGPAIDEPSQEAYPVPIIAEYILSPGAAKSTVGWYEAHPPHWPLQPIAHTEITFS